MSPLKIDAAMNLTEESLTQTLVNEWQEYFQYWSAVHNSDSRQEYRTFTHSEIAQAQIICNRLRRLDNCADEECNAYAHLMDKMSAMLR